MDRTVVYLVLFSTILFILVPELLWGTLLLAVIYSLGQVCQKVIHQSMRAERLKEYRYQDSLN